MRIPIVVLFVVIAYCSMFIPPAESRSSSADASSTDTQQGTDSEAGAGVRAASAAATIPYLPFKTAFAIAGVLVGCLACVFSGFSEPTAKSVWIPSTFGTYVITPEHLTGGRPVRFLGVAAESEGMPSAPTAIND